VCVCVYGIIIDGNIFESMTLYAVHDLKSAINFSK